MEPFLMYGGFGIVIAGLLMGLLETAQPTYSNGKFIEPKPKYVPFDPDYYAIGVLEPEFVEPTVLRWKVI
jgi:hypothetical protein